VKQNFFESHSVHDFLNVMYETIPRRRFCIREASLAEYNTCTWSLIFASTGRAQTSMGLQICYGSDVVSNVGWCSGAQEDLGCSTFQLQ